MTTTSQVPRCLTLIPTLNTVTNLLTALQAIDPGVPSGAQHCQIQLDPAAGSAFLYIGNSDVSPTVWGVKLNAGQAWSPPALSSGLIQLGQLFIYCDTGSCSVGVVVVPR